MNKLEAVVKRSKEKGFKSLNEECQANKDCMCHGCSFYQIMKHNMCKVWVCADRLLEPYEELIELTQFEYDLLSIMIWSHDYAFENIDLLSTLKEKGHFKGITNTSMFIKDILKNAKAVG